MERPLKRNTMVREEPWASVTRFRCLGSVWAGVREAMASFSSLETRYSEELDTLGTQMSGRFSRNKR